MPNYGEIYDDIIRRQENYNLAENSPGYQTCVAAEDTLRLLDGNSLDVGCGVGFVVDYLSGIPFQFQVWGVDASAVAVERARARVTKKHAVPADRIQQIGNQKLPFADHFFSLVTCFDMLEHLDENHILEAIQEMDRVTAPGGILYCSVSCRLAGSKDLHGDNLHRTVQSVDWWLTRIQPEKAIYDAKRAQLTIWKKKKRT